MNGHHQHQRSESVNSHQFITLISVGKEGWKASLSIVPGNDNLFMYTLTPPTDESPYFRMASVSYVGELLDYVVRFAANVEPPYDVISWNFRELQILTERLGRFSEPVFFPSNASDLSKCDNQHGETVRYMEISNKYFQCVYAGNIEFPLSQNDTRLKNILPYDDIE